MGAMDLAGIFIVSLCQREAKRTRVRDNFKVTFLGIYRLSFYNLMPIPRGTSGNLQKIMNMVLLSALVVMYQ